MKIEKPFLSPMQKQEVVQQTRQSRKSTIWTKEKINQLIELYEKNECLWNHWHESYKSREKRKRAINEICTALRVSKFEFGKKVHNLRNQFNTEMKKLEHRVEEAGISLEEAANTELRSKWTHFESLKFLRNIIEPRPGIYQTNYQAPKKLRLKFDFNNTEEDINISSAVLDNNSSASANATNPEDLSHFQYNDDNGSEEVVTDDYQSFENAVVEVTPATTTREEVYDQKYQPPQTANHDHHPPTVVATRSFTHNSKKQKPSSANSSSSLPTEIISINDEPSIVELNTSNLTVVPSSHSLITTTASSSCSSSSNATPVIASVTSGNSSNRPSNVLHDQWDAFGELVANEFRNLNSDLSRKRLKRKIMQAMLEIGEDDDSLTANRTRSN